jgi:hypothetical protein
MITMVSDIVIKLGLELGLGAQLGLGLQSVNHLK